ncbi:MAG: tRNA pseudouridine(55) synthase TruB [Planctomycetaceae bacterium]
MSQLFGIVNVNKSQYVSSRGAVNAVQRVVKPLKVGHAGTLDPMATGVLLVCVGKATRLVTRIHNLPKVYRATFVFAPTSDTDDAMGTIEQTGQPIPTRGDVEALLPEFTGEIQQVPPIYSAVHVNGQRAYEIARRGHSVELKPKSVRVDRLELTGAAEGKFEFEIECGSGTYIRSIARDMGERLGCGGLMSALERTRIGSFTVEDGIDVGGGPMDFDKLSQDDIEQALISPLAALPQVVQYQCNDIETTMVRLGTALKTVPAGVSADDEVAMVGPSGQLLALAAVQRGMLQPRLVFDALQ